MLAFALTLAVCEATAAWSAPATVSWGKLSLQMSETGPGNVLPQYLFLQGSEEGGSTAVKIGGGRGKSLPFQPDDSCDDDIFDGANPDLRSPQLPHLTQDRWGCERKDSVEIDVVVLENERLRATITPQFGGKVWALYDKKFDKEMVYNNGAHQPANIGALKAWSAGGIEFNWSPGIIGHSAFSESPVHVAKLDTERGPVVRVYEYDRYNNTAWQVDILLQDDVLWVHPRITNPSNADLRGYWWTCVAHTITENSRVITPATSTVQTSSPGGVSKSDWPVFNMDIQDPGFVGVQGGPGGGADNSFMGNTYDHIDIFVRIPKPRLPYIAHAGEEGYTVVHGHEINGTKLFTWGQSPMAKFWMDFLAGGRQGKGDYAELQIGPAPTQMQTFSVPKNSTVQWTSWFKGFSGDPAQLHAQNYSDATAYVESKFPDKADIASVGAFLTEFSTTPVTAGDLLSAGSSWGALYNELVSKLGQDDVQPLPSWLYFPLNASDPDLRPWLELVRNGSFSDETLAESPTSYNTRAEWVGAVEASAAAGPATWLHAFHQGVAAAERGNTAGATALFQQSLQAKPTAQGYRSLAVLSSDAQTAADYFEKAWPLAVSATYRGADRLRANLATEYVQFLMGIDDLSSLATFLNASVPQASNAGDILKLDSVIEASVRVALYVDGDADKAIQVIESECFPTYGSARAELISLWNDAYYTLKSRELGRPLTFLDQHRVRVANPPPKNIGCPYPDSTCRTYKRD